MAREPLRLRQLQLAGEGLDPEAFLKGMSALDPSYVRAQWRSRGFKELRELTDACLLAVNAGREALLCDGEAALLSLMMLRTLAC